MKDLKIFCLCIHDHIFSTIKSLNYIPVGLGSSNFSKDWIRDNTGSNISHKNKYYAEYTFHYWLWKNNLGILNKNKWIGFCGYREFWSQNITDKPNEIVNSRKILIKKALKTKPNNWENYDVIIGTELFINKVPLMKILKRGIPSLFKNPSALFPTNRNIKFHFDMMHGIGNLEKAIDLLDKKNKDDFKEYVLNNISFSRGNMFLTKSKKILENYYSSIFKWLNKCEDIFGFKLSGYGMMRIYAFLAERYLSYWFKKYSNYLQWPVFFCDTSKFK